MYSFYILEKRGQICFLCFTCAEIFCKSFVSFGNHCWFPFPYPILFHDFIDLLYQTYITYDWTLDYVSPLLNPSLQVPFLFFADLSNMFRRQILSFLFTKFSLVFFCKTIWSTSFYVSIIQSIVFLTTLKWRRQFENEGILKLEFRDGWNRALCSGRLSESQLCHRPVCTVTHHCGTVGRMRGSYRTNKRHMGKERRRKEVNKSGGGVKIWNTEIIGKGIASGDKNSRLDSFLKRF